MKKMKANLAILGIYALSTIPIQAASRLTNYYQQLEAAPDQQSESEILNGFAKSNLFDFEKMTPSDELPVLAAALKSSHPLIAEFAGMQLTGAAMAWASNNAAMDQLRALMPAMVAHFDDPALASTDPTQIGMKSTWKQTIIRFVILTDSPISTGLQSKIVASLADPELTKYAANALVQTKPLSKSVLAILVSKMADSSYSRAVITTALGRVAVNDSDVINAIVSSLTYASPLPDPQKVQTDAVHRAAVEALGEIGAPAQSAIPSIRALINNPNEAPFTKEQAQIALARLEATAK